MTGPDPSARLSAVRRLAGQALAARRDALGARNHDEEISARRRQIAVCDALVDTLAVLEQAGVLARIEALLEMGARPAPADGRG